MHTPCVCVCLCLSVSSEISGMKHHITMLYSPAQKALPGELYKELDEFLTQIQVVNAPFAFLCGFNVPCMKLCPWLTMQDVHVPHLGVLEEGL